MELVTYNGILSDNSHFAIVWKGKYNNKDCVIKMILLNSGLHYNRKKQIYQDGKLEIPEGEKHFKKNDTKPFLHHKFNKKRSMSIDKFMHEIHMFKVIDNIRLAPKVYHHWINQKYHQHYGFIVMERLTCTVKDILLKRDLNSDELKYITSKIHKLHDNNYSHGSMKPSNIGVNLDKFGHINYIRILDWARSTYTTDKQSYKRDIKNYNHHTQNNISKRKF